MTSTSNIPDKLYFKIGEVARIAGVKPYVLRYWETEFKSLSPLKSKSGQRLYRRREVDLVLKIKDLLYSQRFTIEGARRKIREIADEVAAANGSTPQEAAAPADQDRKEVLLEMRKAVVELLELTSGSPTDETSTEVETSPEVKSLLS